MNASPVWGHLFLRYLLIALLAILQFMHVWWFSIIVTMIVKFARGEMDGDERSDDDEIDEQEERERPGEGEENLPEELSGRSQRNGKKEN